MKMRYILVLLVFVSHMANAQKSKKDEQPDKAKGNTKSQNDVLMFSKSTDEGLVLRWAPTNAITWLQGNQYGYSIDKLIIDGSNNKIYAKVGNAPIKPWPLEKWEPFVNDAHPYVAAAAMTIYGVAKNSSASKSFVQADEELNNRYGFALLSADFDKLAAEASGLTYVDKSVKRNTMAVYRIYIVDSLNQPLSDTSFQLLNYGATEVFNAQEFLTPVESDRSILLEWPIRADGMLNTGYYIERSDDNGKTFKKVNERPYVNMSTNATTDRYFISYSDSVPMNYKKYYYRLVALDAFGDQSNPSKAIMAMARDRTPPKAIEIVTTSETPEHFVKLEWKYKPVEGDFKGFKVYRLNDQEVYVPISSLLGSTTFNFVDKKPDPIQTNLYKVMTVDTAGNESASPEKFAMVTDQTPPAPPTNLKYKIDSTGTLLINWDAPKDNDVRGYLVHYSNDLRSDFAVKPGEYLANTHFIERLNLNNLSEEVYYYVIAIDRSYNASVASEILKVKKPDKHPPTASIFSDYYVSEEGILLKWNKSTSTDVEKVELKRRSQDADWEVMKGFDQNKNTFLDKSVVEGVAYEYNLWTYDDDGNVTINEKPISLIALKSFYLKEVPVLKAELLKEGVALTITYSTYQDMEFRIYRKVEDGQLCTYTLLSSELSFLDQKVAKKTNYTYAVIAIAPDGRESKMSPLLKVTR